MRTNLLAFGAVALMSIASISTFAQGKKAWPELSAFHSVMSQIFHPAEEGDLKPMRERSGELLEKAKAWKASAIPDDYGDVKGIEESLSALVEGSAKLDERIKAGAKDEEVLKDLGALHDVFHTIVGLCGPGH